jgi:hypothetical protein
MEYHLPSAICYLSRQQPIHRRADVGLAHQAFADEHGIDARLL